MSDTITFDDLPDASSVKFDDLPDASSIGFDDLPDDKFNQNRGFFGNFSASARRGLETGLIEAPAALYGAGGDDAARRAAAEAIANRQIAAPDFEGQEDVNKMGEQLRSGQYLSAAKTLLMNPLDIVGNLAAEGIGSSAVPLAFGAAGAGAGTLAAPGVGTIAGGAVGLGTGSGLVEAGSTILDTMGSKGIDLTNADQIYAAFNDPALMAEAKDRALKRGVAVGVFDAATAGLAGRLLAGARNTLGSKLARGAGEVGIQAAGGAGGDIAGQLLTDGRVTDVASPVFEAIGEIGGGAPEIVAGARIRGRAEQEAPPLEGEQEQTPPPPPATPLDPATLGLPPKEGNVSIRWTDNAEPDLYQVEDVVQGDAEPIVRLRTTREGGSRVENFLWSDIKDLVAPVEVTTDPGSTSPKGADRAEASITTKGPAEGDMPPAPSLSMYEAQASQVREPDAQIKNLTDQEEPDIPPRQTPPQQSLALPDNALREIEGLQSLIDRNEDRLNKLPDDSEDQETQNLRAGILDTIERSQRKIGQLRAQYTPKQTVQSGEPGGVRQPPPLPGGLGVAAEKNESKRIKESAGSGVALQYPDYQSFLNANSEFSPEDIAQGSGIANEEQFLRTRENEIKQYVEAPVQDLVRKVYSLGGSPFSSNAYGPGRRGVDYVDSNGNNKFIPLPTDTTARQPRIGSLTVPEGRPTVADTGETLTAPQTAPRPGLAAMPLESAMAGRQSVADTGKLDTGPTVRTPVAPAPLPLEQGMAGRTSVADTGESITRPMTAGQKEIQKKLELQRNQTFKKPETLLQALKRIGIRKGDPALSDIDKSKLLPGTIVTRKGDKRGIGRTLADIHQVLEQDGFIEKRRDVEQYTSQDINTLKEAIDQDFAGKNPVWAAIDQEQGARWLEQEKALNSQKEFEAQWGPGAVGRLRAELKTKFNVDTEPKATLGELQRRLNKEIEDAETRVAEADNSLSEKQKNDLADAFLIDRVTPVLDADARAVDEDTPHMETAYEPFDLTEAQDTDTRSTQSRVGTEAAGLQQTGAQSETAAQGQERGAAENVVSEPLPEGDTTAIEDEDNADIAAAVAAAGVKRAPVRQPMKRAPGRGYKSPAIERSLNPNETIWYRGQIGDRASLDSFEASALGAPSFADSPEVASGYAENPNAAGLYGFFGARTSSASEGGNVTRNKFTGKALILTDFQGGHTTKTGFTPKAVTQILRMLNVEQSTIDRIVGGLPFSAQYGRGRNTYYDAAEGDVPNSRKIVAAYELIDDPDFQYAVKEAGYDGISFVGAANKESDIADTNVPWSENVLHAELRALNPKSIVNAIGANAGYKPSEDRHIELDVPISDIEHGESATPGGSLTWPGAWAKVNDYASRKTPIPAIDVVSTEPGSATPFMVVDGSHRLEAAKKKGQKFIRVRVSNSDVEGLQFAKNYQQALLSAPGRRYKPSEKGGIYLGPKRQPMRRGEKSDLERKTAAIIDAINKRITKALSKQNMLNTTARVNATVPKTTDNPYNPGWDLSAASQLTTFMSGVAAKDQHVGLYHQKLQDKHKFERGMIKEGEDRLRAAFDLPDASRKKINAVMEHDRLMGVDRTNFKARVAVIIPENYKGDLGKPGQRIELSRAETDALRDIRGYLNDRFDQELRTYAQGVGYDGALTEKAVSEQIKELTPDSQSKDREKASVAKRKIQMLGLVQEKIANTIKAKRMGYVPFRRYGDVRITVNPELRAGVDADEKLEKTRVVHVETRPRWEFLYTGRADALRKYQKEQVDKTIAELRKKYPEGKYKIGWQKVEENPFEGISIEDLEQLGSAMAKLNDPQTADDIFEKVVKQMKRQMAASYKHMSENVPGYSTDFFRALADHNRVTSVVAAQQRFGMDVKNAYDAVQKNSGKNTKAFVERYNNYLDSDEAVIGRLKQFGFWANIWGSPSSALVNLFQTPTITAAQIAAWGGRGGYGRTLKLLLSVSRAMRVNKDGAILDFDKIKMTPDERKAFMAAVKAGTIDPGVAQDLMGDEPNKFGQKRETQEFFGRVFKVGSSMFNSAEQINRAVAWLSAYREIQRPGAMQKFMKMYAKDERVQTLRRQDRLSPADIAEFVTNDTQFIGGKFDRPEAMRGIWGVAFQFKTYPLNYMRLLYGNFTRMGPEGKVAGMIMLATMLGLSGLLGLPFAEDALNVADAIGKFLNDGVDPMLEREMRQFMGDLGWSTEGAEAVLRGPSRMLGVDLSKRLGMGEVAPDADLMMSIPIVSATWGRMDEYYHRKESGQPIGAAIAAAAPIVGKGPADLARGLLQVPEEGVRTKYGDTRIFPSETTAGQAAAKALGFQPATFARKQEEAFRDRGLERKTRDAETALRSKLSGYLADSIVARRTGDTERANEMMAKYRAAYKDAYDAFRNEKVLEDKISVPSQQVVSKRAREMADERLKIKSAPKNKRAALAEQQEDSLVLED